ncbi:hypothetical protein BVC80_1835g62 [Macleaya cordata]|uniref:F-box domain n=1 Tax=Macleaya cordata TaxID=56857 RepID=A0A200R4R8_MACCD|nr:hypothetical protein BVC80_1835g62 [Macleaya cordata]
MDTAAYDRKKKRSSSASSSTTKAEPFFSDEIIFIILSCINPADSQLIRSCRLVCKLWYSMIHELLVQPKPSQLLIQNPKIANSISFMEFNERKDQVTGLRDLNLDFVESDEGKDEFGNIRDLNLDFLGVVRGTCNGLILVQRFFDKLHFSLHVLNPLTRQCISLPTPTIWSFKIWFGIAFVQSSREFKVLLAFGHRTILRCEILTLGSSSDSKYWITIDWPAFYKRLQNSTEQPIVVNGIFHLKTGFRYLISINAGDETIHKTHFPNLSIIVKNSHVVEMGGSLGLIEHNFDRLEVWILKDFQNSKWIKQDKIIMKGPRPTISLNIFRDQLIPIVSLRNGQVIIFRKFHDKYSGLYFFDIKHQEMRKIAELDINDQMVCLPYTVAAFSLPGVDDQKGGENKDQEQV